MRPGRYPAGHPLEHQARLKLAPKQRTAIDALTGPAPRPQVQAPKQQVKRRWVK